MRSIILSTIIAAACVSSALAFNTQKRDDVVRRFSPTPSGTPACRKVCPPSFAEFYEYSIEHEAGTEIGPNTQCRHTHVDDAYRASVNCYYSLTTHVGLGDNDPACAPSQPDKDTCKDWPGVVAGEVGIYIDRFPDTSYVQNGNQQCIYYFRPNDPALWSYGYCVYNTETGAEVSETVPNTCYEVRTYCDQPGKRRRLRPAEEAIRRRQYAGPKKRA